MEKREIPFPQSFDLKLIVEASIPIQETKDSIELALTRCGVENRFINTLASTKGRYLSYAYRVKVDSKQQLDCLYAEVANVKGIKFAL